MEQEEATTPEDLEEEESSEEGRSEDHSFSPFEEIQEEFNPGPVPKVTGSDGLPMQVYESSGETDIPVLSPDTLLCMGDYSLFYFGIDSFTFDQVVRIDGDWVLKENHAMHVRPKRDPCRHYVRQMLQSDLNPQLKIISRLCSARRDRQGAFLSVRDRAVFACDMREPRDDVSDQILDSFDREKMSQGRQRQFLPMFKEGKKNGNK